MVPEVTVTPRSTRRSYADLVIFGLAAAVTPARMPAPIRGRDLGRVVTVEHAAIAVRHGRVVLIGPEADVRAGVDTDVETLFWDARGAIALPGFVDCHTHAAFAGDRAADFERRNQGQTYEQIHAAGGGIQTTVDATRAAIADGTLESTTRQHLDWLLAAGTTTAEVKSGYGLSIETELAQLRAARAAAQDHLVRITTTVLAAHTTPAEFRGQPDSYLTNVALPAVRAAAAQGLATAADIFVETGSFNVSQASHYLRAAHSAGLAMRLHADQFTELGALELAVELGARSVDHLEATGPDGVRVLARSNTAAVLLPTSSLFLGRPYAPGRALVDAGAVVALASDFNPGSSYAESLPLAMSLACLGAGLTAAEALTAMTVNAAWVLGLDGEVGRLAPGHRADILLVRQPSLEHLAYHVGSAMIEQVFAGGVPVPSGDSPVAAPG